jgi:hypothetical protein
VEYQTIARLPCYCENIEERHVMENLSRLEVVRGMTGYPQKSEESEFSLDDCESLSWPSLDEKALFGFAGEFVHLATEMSEADPAAVLLTFLTRFAVECGPRRYLMIGDTRHYARIFSVIVGATSKARKGTSGKPVLRLFDFHSAISSHANLSSIQYTTARMSPGPLSSGEGIIHHVRDEILEWSPKKGEYIMTKPGVADKRLFILDEEFGSALSCTKREGNTLSTTLRSAWDTGTLEPLTKTSPTKATGAHLGITTHITLEELRQKMNETEAFNGFANRFLWCCARRSKLVPNPEPMSPQVISKLQCGLLDIICKASNCEEMKLDGYARDLWNSVYPDLTKDRGGLVGAVTNRAEAQVRRLSMIYALLGKEPFIRLKHLEAALALWAYCEASARFIFSNRESNPCAKRILQALRSGPKTTTDLHAHFQRRIKRDQLHEALTELIASGKIESFKRETGGKPQTLFRLCGNKTGDKDIYEK